MVQAARREQARGDIDRAVDPGRCHELWALDEATQRDLLELMNVKSPESGRYSQAMEGLAEALAAPQVMPISKEPATP